MGSSAIVGINPIIDILLQLFNTGVQLLAESDLIKLLQHCAMKPLINPIRLRRLGFGRGVVDILDR